MEKSLIIIPTYNEKENISAIIQNIMSLNLNSDILVVDDNSPDGTADIVKKKENDYPGSIFLIKRTAKLGLGTAYIEGFRFGIQHSYDLIIEMDADFSHNPKDLNRLIDMCKKGEADICVGSRYVKGGGIENWPLDRLLLSRGASIYVQALTWMSVKDPTSGFVCYRREVLETMDLNKIKFIGYAFQIQMKYAALKLGFKIKEIPIVFVDRKRGTSKMNLSIVKEAIFGVIQMKFQTLFNPLYYSSKL